MLRTGPARWLCALKWLVALVVFGASAPVSADPLPSTLDDFFHPGTQPDTSGGVDFDPILASYNCRACHELTGETEVPVFSRWNGSMMAQSVRDPVFQAALVIANQDAAFSGDICLRCHAPGAWLAGRSTPTDGSALTADDYDGVTCNFCHRLVDPVYEAGVSPPDDEPILDDLAALGLLPADRGGGNYVVDPSDVRRGPFDDVPLNLHGVPILVSPLHQKAELCASCHEVSNPLFTRQPDGSYAMNTLGAEHPTSLNAEMFPVERTYSEWLNSQFANGGVDLGGIFGGNHPTGIMETCQDCHMPDMATRGCVFGDPFQDRPDVPSHDFGGGNTWVQDMVYNLYPDDTSYEYLQESKDRATYMLQNAALVEVTAGACSIDVRVTNQTGHKLPTGYPEGRRMWLSVEFRDEGLSPILTRGAYDFLSADLTTDTKVYEALAGLDAAMAALTGLPAGPSFHFVLNNQWYKDNRIPPRGFTNAAYAAFGGAPVGASYADGQYWDDTTFRVPAGATSAVVRLHYQTASKEYIEFLRDENSTNDAGDVLYDQWQQTGMSEPVLMREVTVSGLTGAAFGDADCDADVDLADWALLYGCLSGPDGVLGLGCEALDAQHDARTDLSDVAAWQNVYDGV